ncbi:MULTISPECIES: hypothetical protein [Clostridium]|uniref:hypothetical protein n=1 Tax=Clostridium TaxID=1485 RepID=UPI002432042A|nr:hypothetical protein [Clostridium tyrobutyricum]
MLWRKLKIRVIGTKKKTAEVEKLLDTVELTGNEAKDRLILQEFIDSNKIKETILYDGNGIVSYDRIVNEYKKILKKNTFGNMSDYFYEFLCSNAGSIAHYNKQGWLYEYNSIYKLKNFFLYNENGKNIVDEQPRWKTDVIRIAKAILDLTTQKEIVYIDNKKEEKGKIKNSNNEVKQLSLLDLIA